MFNILSPWDVIAVPKKIFLHTFLWGLRLFSVLKNEGNSNEKNDHHVLKLFLPIMWIAFLLQDNVSFLFLRSRSLRDFCFTV